MTFEQIRTFLWVARLGGFRKASERLNVTQPAVSTRISSLEDELQAKLFERGSGQLILTKQGQQLLGYAEQMLFVEEEIKQRVANPSQTRGMFRIGASETVAQSWLAEFIKVFSTQYPEVNLDLMVDISINLRDALLSRRVDVVFMLGPISDFSVKNVELPSFEMAWYKAKGFGEVDFEKTPVISYSSDTRPFREVSSELARRIGPKTRFFSSAAISASLKIIAEGIAVGPFPRLIAAPEFSGEPIEEFDAGFIPSALEFTASYLAEPRSFLIENSAEIARDVATGWHARNA